MICFFSYFVQQHHPAHKNNNTIFENSSYAPLPLEPVEITKGALDASNITEMYKGPEDVNSSTTVLTLEATHAQQQQLQPSGSQTIAVSPTHHLPLESNEPQSHLRPSLAMDSAVAAENVMVSAVVTTNASASWTPLTPPQSALQ